MLKACTHFVLKIEKGGETDNVKVVSASVVFVKVIVRLFWGWEDGWVDQTTNLTYCWPSKCFCLSRVKWGRMVVAARSSSRGLTSIFSSVSDSECSQLIFAVNFERNFAQFDGGVKIAVKVAESFAGIIAYPPPPKSTTWMKYWKYLGV